MGFGLSSSNGSSASLGGGPGSFLAIACWGTWSWFRGCLPYLARWGPVGRAVGGVFPFPFPFLFRGFWLCVLCGLCLSVCMVLDFPTASAAPLLYVGGPEASLPLLPGGLGFGYGGATLTRLGGKGEERRDPVSRFRFQRASCGSAGAEIRSLLSTFFSIFRLLFVLGSTLASCLASPCCGSSSPLC